MAKSKLFGKTRLFLFKALPQTYRWRLLQWIIARRFKSPPLIYPWKTAGIKKVFVILPEEPVEAFHQIINYVRISALFEQASFTLFCTKEVAPYFKQIHPQATVIEYDKDMRYLFSPEFTAWGKELNREDFDVCLMLERTPDISLQYLAGKTVAAVRAGYSGAGDFPFLNFHVNPSEKRMYRADQNALMAGVFGASERIKVRWTVSKETVEEVSHLLRESSIAATAHIGCIDAGYLRSAFGAEWTRKLCSALLTVKGITWCIVSTADAEAGFAQSPGSQPMASFSNLSASRCAGLLTRSVCVVSGVSVIFELAHLLHRPLVGVFEKNLLARYCRESDLTKGIPYDETSGQAAIQSIAALAQTLSGTEKL